MELNVTSKKELDGYVKNSSTMTLDEKIKICEQLQAEAEVLCQYIQRMTDAVPLIMKKSKDEAKH
jgi:hypothetical protein